MRKASRTKIPYLWAFALAAFALGASAVEAQTYYVAAGANGNGSDWANAYGALPASLVRGATYYVAAGRYSGYVFDDPASGTSVITVKKATAADHGTSTGWQAAYANQAVFAGTLQFQSNNYVFDGQVRNPDWRSGYGFKVDVSQAGGNYGIEVGIAFQLAVSNITVRHTEIQGTGDRTDKYNDRGLVTALGSSNVTLSRSYVHDQGNVNLHLFRTTNVIVEYTWMARNHSTPADHSEGVAAPEGTSNFVFRYNVMEDIEGTAFIATPTGGHPACSGTSQRDWYIYGNVFMNKLGSSVGTGGGVLYIFDANHTGDLVFFNNTIANVGVGSVGLETGSASAGCAASMKVQNNIWYNVGQAVNRTGGVTNLTWSHNSYYQTATSDPDANKQSGSLNPFLNVAGFDLNLSSETATGLVLGAPYNVDAYGRTRGSDGKWDRGAFEFGLSGPTPDAPSNLQISD